MGWVTTNQWETNINLFYSVACVRSSFAGVPSPSPSVVFCRFNPAVRMNTWLQLPVQATSNPVCCQFLLDSVQMGNKTSWLLEIDFNKMRDFNSWISNMLKPMCNDVSRPTWQDAVIDAYPVLSNNKLICIYSVYITLRLSSAFKKVLAITYNINASFKVLRLSLNIENPWSMERSIMKSHLTLSNKK